MDIQDPLSQLRKKKHLLTQQVGSETLVYNELTHQAFCLNAVAAQIWQRLEEGGSVAQIAAAATLELRAPVTEETVLFTIGELRRDGLIASESPNIATPIPSRRVLLRQLGAGAIVLLPAIAVIVAPKAAQAYNGCADCSLDKRGHGSLGTPSATRGKRPSDSIFIAPQGGSADSTQAIREREKKNGEIFVP